MNHILPRIRIAPDANMSASGLVAVLIAIQALDRRMAKIEALLRAAGPQSQPLAALEAQWAIIPEGPLMQIAERISLATGVSVAALRGLDRMQGPAMARRLFCAAARRDGFSSPEIGRWLRRDHTTVLAAARREPAAIAYFARFGVTLRDDHP